MLQSSRSSREVQRGRCDTYLCNRRHGKLEGQAWCWLVELHLVFFRIVLLLEHRSAVLGDESIHLELQQRSDLKVGKGVVEVMGIDQAWEVDALMELQATMADATELSGT